MNRVNFVFDDVSHYALYELVGLDGSSEFYLELRDRALISEFGLGFRFRTDGEGRLQPDPADTPRKKELLNTILHSINQETTS